MWEIVVSGEVALVSLGQLSRSTGVVACTQDGHVDIVVSGAVVMNTCSQNLDSILAPLV